MSKVAGFALIVAGLGVGVFAIAPLDNLGEQPELAQSPTSSPAVRGAMVKPGNMPMPHSPAAEASRFSSPFVTTVAPYIDKPRIPQEHFAIPKYRDALTRELQKELRRVGCYEGDISGTWSQSTRRAMKTFIERMNARLPIEEPDAVLYALVKGQDELVCGKACSHGEVQSADGRCIPGVLLAYVKGRTAQSLTAAVEKTGMASIGGSVNTMPQSTEQSLEGRMGLAGPPGPTLGTTTQLRRDRVTPAMMSARQPHVGPRAQRRSTAIFSSRFSNN